MGFRIALPASRRTAPLVIVIGTGIALSMLMRPAAGAGAAPAPWSPQAAQVQSAWKGVTTALDAYQSYSRSSAQDRPAGEAGLVVVRRSAERARGYLDAVDAARVAWDAATGAGRLPAKAGDGLPSDPAADEAGEAVAVWVDAQRAQSRLVTACLGSTTTLAGAQACFRSRVDGETQQSWLAAATRVGRARSALEKELSAG